MTLLDRHILARFLGNFLILLVVLFLFAACIDVIVALDEFVDQARDDVGADASGLAALMRMLVLAIDFEAPRLFQFYAYLHGLVAVGAAAFTLARMHRHRELVAMLSAGISMPRAAMPFAIGVFGLSLGQVLNQELLLPRVAPLVLRDHGDIGARSLRRFPVDFTPDGGGALWHSPMFTPDEETIESPTVIERDARGRAVRRISATRGVWLPPSADGDRPGGWRLEGGLAVSLEAAFDAGRPRIEREPTEFQPTDLSPRVLIVRRYRQFAGMLSLAQISEILETPGAAEQQGVLDALKRHRYGRFASVLVNMLVMWLALPTFLLREPANLLHRSLRCAGTAIPALLGAAIFMHVDIPGIAPAVSVFLPVVILLPIVLAQWTMVKS